MNHKELMAFMKDRHLLDEEVFDAKNQDYGGIFALLDAAELIGLNPMHCLMWEELKKTARVVHLTVPHVEAKVKTESVTQNLSDMRNYSVFAEAEIERSKPKLKKVWKK